MLATSGGGEFGGSFLAGWNKAHFASLLTEFVNPQVLFSFSFCRREVEGLWLFRGVDGASSFADFLALRKQSPCAVRAVDDTEFSSVLFPSLVAVHFKGDDSPSPFDQLVVFLDRLILGIVGVSNRRNCREKDSDNEQPDR